MIALYHPGLPPSANNAYVNIPRGGRRLSKEGEKYKNETVAYFARTYREGLKTFRKDVPYLVVMLFYFDQIENEGWATGKAKNRYKRFDATNRPKLLEDVLKAAAGIDDSQHVAVYLQKRAVVECEARATARGSLVENHSQEHVDVLVWDLEKEANPFDAALRVRT